MERMFSKNIKNFAEENIVGKHSMGVFKDKKMDWWTGWITNWWTYWKLEA